MDRLEIYNNPHFRTASLYQHKAFVELKTMGMSDQDAKEWILAWNSQNTTKEP